MKIDVFTLFPAMFAGPLDESIIMRARKSGLLDLKTLRLAMIHPDREEYAASVPKIGILLAYFQLHPEEVQPGKKCPVLR